MNELAKKLGIELKPFCVRNEEFPSAQICQDFLDRCVSLGAEADEGVEGTLREHNYDTSYHLVFCALWGVTESMYTLTLELCDVKGYGCEIITYQEMLPYLQLTEKDGRLVPNEDLQGKPYIIPPLDNIPYTVTNEEVRTKRYLQEAGKPLVSSSEPVSMIKGKVVPAELERLLCAVVAYSEGEDLVSKDNGSIYYFNEVEWRDLIREPSLLNRFNLCPKSEYEQITLDKELQEAEEELLKAQAKVDELKKRKG